VSINLELVDQTESVQITDRNNTYTHTEREREREVQSGVESQNTHTVWGWKLLLNL